MKKPVLLFLAYFLVILLGACSGNQFDPKSEQEKATSVMNGVLTSFHDQEKLAEADTSDEANNVAWKKIKEKNKNVISKDLNKENQRRFLYLLTTNEAQDVSNGKTKANLVFSQDNKINKVSFNESNKTFTFDIKRSGFDHKLITMEKLDNVWKITKVQQPA